MSSLTVDQFKAALPAKVRQNVSQELVNKVKHLMSDPDMQEAYRENLLSYASILNEGKFKLTSYVDAVKYCSLRLGGKNIQDAYAITFPDKVQDWAARNVPTKDQASYRAVYNKSKLVTRIMEQAQIPMWLLNQDMYQKALNTQAELMVSANSEKVRSDAANSILTHLKMPETQKIELDVGVKEDSSIKALRESTMELVAAQRRAIASGAMNAQEVAHSKVIEGERVDDE